LTQDRYRRLGAVLISELKNIPKTDGLYHPCMVTLVDGQVVDRVYLAQADLWHYHWGVWPSEDSGKQEIFVDDVVSVRASPTRLPADLANKLYHAGESGMGYTIFTAVFADGSRQAFSTGNAVDFVRYPKDQSMDTIVDVLPHIGRDNSPRQCPDYRWCLFQSP